MSRRAGGCFRLSRIYHTSTLHLTSTTSVVSEKLSKKPPARYPWTLLVSLQPGGKLIVEKQGDGGGAVVIELDAGDAVLFRSGSNKHGLRRQTNMVVPRTPMRLHEYWEPEGAEAYEFRVALRYASDAGGNQLHAVR